ncbi:MAG: hypothetical protein R3208_20155 [Ketobacteraceae bacterium]|nr:hypothetical protein [Ketobacteraceae bacterium]
MNSTRLLLTIFALSLCAGNLAHAKHEKEKQLPPGLQKKVQSGKSLPPGWQKKLETGEVLDDDIYEHGHVVDRDDGLVTINVEGKLIRVIENTREIVEILEGL